MQDERVRRVCNLHQWRAGRRGGIHLRRAIGAERRAGQDGVALVAVLLLTAVMVALSVVASRNARMELRVGKNDQLAKDAMAIAEAGAYHAADLIKHATPIDFNSCLGSGGAGGSLSSVGSTVTLEDGNSYRFRAFGDMPGAGYYVRAVDDYDEVPNDPTHDANSSIWIVSRGRVGGAERRIEVRVTVLGSAPGGVFGKTSVMLGGSGGFVDSYDSRLGPYSAQTPGTDGDVTSNGGVQLKSDDMIYGDASAGGTVTCSSKCSKQVTGNLTNNAPPINLNPDPYPACGPYTDGTGVQGGTYYGATGKKAGQLVGGSGQTITLAPGTYCFSSIDISGGGILAVSGPVQIMLTAQSSFGGGAVVNTTQIAANLQIYSSLIYDKAGITINGGSDAYMQLYAPGTQVVLGGGADFYGSIVAGSISSTGGSRIHSDSALGQPGSGGILLSGWHEVRN